ncbi:MAG: response regulator transcription factor [Luteolibacter sp.]
MPVIAANAISVCLIEDHSEFRRALLEAIVTTDNMSCNGSFSSAEAAISHLEKGNRPDIIVLDLGLPGMDGLDAIPNILQICPEAKILVLTVFENKARVFRALGAGASGYLIKSAGIDAIIKGIEDARNGICPLSADIAKLVFATFSNDDCPPSDSPISKRETGVLKMLAGGSSRQKVAKSLELSLHTVDSHVRNIYRKLQVNNLSGAVTKANSLHII